MGWNTKLIDKQNQEFSLDESRITIACSPLKKQMWKVFFGSIKRGRLDVLYNMFVYVMKRLTKNKTYPNEFGKIYNFLIGVPPHVEIKIIRTEDKDEDLSIILAAGTDIRTKLLHIYEVIVTNQYSINKRNVGKQVVIDAGANSGTFSVFAAKLGAKKVYAFEPIPELWALLKQNIKLNHLENIVIPINKALGDVSKTVSIDYATVEGGGTITENTMVGKKCEVITIDEFVQKNKIQNIDFIKCDIEGYEKEMLKGAMRTIKKFGPVISISAYHKKEDKEEIPKMLLGFRKDYKYKLNASSEEDFYFWIE